MSKSTRRRKCKSCGQHRLFEKESPNHVLHLLLTVVTFGMWGMIWGLIMIADAFTPYRCSYCGEGRHF